MAILFLPEKSCSITNTYAITRLDGLPLLQVSIPGLGLGSLLGDPLFLLLFTTAHLGEQNDAIGATYRIVAKVLLIEFHTVSTLLSVKLIIK